MCPYVIEQRLPAVVVVVIAHNMQQGERLVENLQNPLITTILRIELRVRAKADALNVYTTSFFLCSLSLVIKVVGEEN